MMTPENGYSQLPTEAPVMQVPHVVLTPEQTLAYIAGSASAAERERKRHRDMTVCWLLDAADLCGGWVPGLGQFIDLISVVACLMMFGPKGFYVLLEMLDISGVVGAFVPTCTLVARSYWNKH